MMLCFVSRSGPTFSMLYLDRATEAISTACCCIGSDMSAFFITAFLCSAMLEFSERTACVYVIGNEIQNV